MTWWGIWFAEAFGSGGYAVPNGAENGDKAHYQNGESQAEKLGDKTKGKFFSADEIA